MSSSYEVDQGKANAVILSAKKVLIPRGQDEILDRLRGCISAAMIGLDKKIIYNVLIISKREWEKANMRQLNDFRFMHVNERIKAFDDMLISFMGELNKLLLSPLSPDDISFNRHSILTNYKDMLETEGYSVTYEF